MGIYKQPTIYKSGLSENEIKELLKGKTIDYDIVLNPYWESKHEITKSNLKEYEDYFIWNSFQIKGKAITTFNATPSDPWYVPGAVIVCYFDLVENIGIDMSRVLFYDYYNGQMDLLSTNIRYRQISGVDRLCLTYSDGSKYGRADAYFNCENFISNKII